MIITLTEIRKLINTYGLKTFVFYRPLAINVPIGRVQLLAALKDAWDGKVGNDPEGMFVAVERGPISIQIVGAHTDGAICSGSHIIISGGY